MHRSSEGRAAQQRDEPDEVRGVPKPRPSQVIPVFGRHVASATRVPSKRPRTSERSRIRQAGVLRPWQSEESVGPFFSSSGLQWAWLCSAMQTTCTHGAL